MHPSTFTGLPINSCPEVCVACEDRILVCFESARAEIVRFERMRSDPSKEQQTRSEAERALDPKGDVLQQRMSSISGGGQYLMVAVEPDPASRSTRHNDRSRNSEKPRAKTVYQLSKGAPHRAIEGIVRCMTLSFLNVWEESVQDASWPLHWQVIMKTKSTFCRHKQKSALTIRILLDEVFQKKRSLIHGFIDVSDNCFCTTVYLLTIYGE